MNRVVLFGCPRPVGGANVEAGDTALLWRKMGVSVTVLPASEESPDNPWPQRLTDAGCRMLAAIPPDRLYRQSGLYRSIVVDFNNERAVRSWDMLSRMGCRFIHVPCMNVAMPYEYDSFRHQPPSAVVFQSEFQRRHMALQYGIWGVPPERQTLIHGAFDPSHFVFPSRPHAAGEPFVVGRLARDAGDKWPKRLWPILEAARAQTPVEADVMGWTPALEKFTGPRPRWVRCWPPGSWPVPHYMAKLHALLCTGDCDENWSRVVLEAMAAGVPVIADASGGFLEQVWHNETGILVATADEASAAIVRLATDEPFRQGLIDRARKWLAQASDPAVLASQWRELFQTVKA